MIEERIHKRMKLSTINFFSYLLLLLLTMVAPLFAESLSPQQRVTKLPALAVSAVRGWTLIREIHEFDEGGYCAVNILYAGKGQEKVPLYESTRPVRCLASAGPYWVLWDTKMAHLGSLIFVVCVPAGGKPLVVFQSQQQESRTYLNDELRSCRFSEGTLRLELLSTEVDTGKQHKRVFTISTEPAMPR